MCKSKWTCILKKKGNGNKGKSDCMRICLYIYMSIEWYMHVMRIWVVKDAYGHEMGDGMNKTKACVNEMCM